MEDSGDRRDSVTGRSLTRREVLTRATYGIGGLLLLRAPGAPRTSIRAVGAAAPRRGVASVRSGRNSAGRATSVVADGATRLPGDGQPRALCQGRSGVVVVGVDEGGEPVSWHSGDGRVWDARRLPPPGSGEAEVWGVAAHGSRYVAVGSVLERRPARVVADRSVADGQTGVTFVDARRRPTVWWTGDGATWAGREVEEVDSAHAQLIAVSCNGSGLVAVGSTLDADGAQGDGGLILTSTDGVAWDEGEIVASADLPEGSFTGVAAASDGWFATSSDMSGGAVWASGDGRRWSVLSRSRRQFAGMTLQGLGVRGRDVHVVATRLSDHATRYFTSSDGCRTWRRLRPRSAGVDVATTVNDLAVIDGAVAVVGTRHHAPVIEGGIADGGN